MNERYITVKHIDIHSGTPTIVGIFVEASVIVENVYGHTFDLYILYRFGTIYDN